MCGSKKPKTPGETEGQKQTAAIAAEKWNYYQQKLVPFENRFIDKAQVKDAEFERAEGMGAVDVQSAFGRQPTVTGGMQRTGNLAGRVAGGALRKASAAASSGVRAVSNTAERRVQGLQAIIAAGNGQKVEAQQGMLRTAANNFGTAMNDARMDAQDELSRSSSIMEGVGAGLGVYANLGTGTSGPTTVGSGGGGGTPSWRRE